MIRTTFPEELQPWKKEVERMLSTIQGSVRTINQQLAGPSLSPGVTVGGIVPTSKECMQFKFKLNGPTPTDCRGCDSDCKTVHISTDIKGIRHALGETTPTVIIPAGDYVLKRYGSINDCTWRIGDLATTYIITFGSVGGTMDGTGQRTAVTIQSHNMIGTLYYYTDVLFSDWICDNIPYADKDPDWTDYPSAITLTSHDCDNPDDAPPDCADGLDIKAEIRWDEASWGWIQSYFSVNGVEGGGSVEGIFDGATFGVRFQLTGSYCLPGDTDVTFKGPVYVDDQCRSTTLRRAGYAQGWPSTLTGKCVDCTPHTTTTSTSTDSTTTGSTTGSTTTGSTTTGSTTTGSTTTGSTTTSTTTGSTTTSTSTTTGSSSSSSGTSSSTSTTTGSSSSGGSCTGSCGWIGVIDSGGCGSPTGFAWSGNGNSCSGCSSPPCYGGSCSDLATYLGRWPGFEGDTISHACI